MRNILTLVLSTFVVALSGCTVSTEALVAGAEDIRVGQNDPETDMVEVGPISATSGNGCGSLGQMGSYEGAYNALKNRAFAMGADYVQILGQSSPTNSSGCRGNTYSISGIAYRRAETSD